MDAMRLRPLSIPADHLRMADLRTQSEGDLLLSLLGVSSLPEEIEERLRGEGGLQALREMEGAELEGLGLQPESIRRLQVCLELSWRLAVSPWRPGEVFQSSEQVFRSYRGLLGREPVEVVWVLLLDARLRKMGRVEISRGTVTGAILHPREVLHPVISRQAAGFILLHNHPSGEATPSQADYQVTKQIAQAAALFHVDFLDHMILTPYEYFSFADHRELS